MLTLIAALLAAAQPATAEPCTADQNCVTTGAAQMFAFADKLFKAGDLEGAAGVLQALTKDKHPELRAEARFRLAAVYEKMGKLEASAEALRALLDEQPDAGRARLELARILSRLGDVKGARAEIAAAQRAGLPPEVQATVRNLSNSLAPARRRGFSLEMSSGPDSNINRATASQYIDTIIAPFVLDPDARRQSGMGATFNGQAWTRNAIGPIDLLTAARARADLFDKRRFNDVQLSADSGPQFSGGIGIIRPALTVERRWFGGKGYSSGNGVLFDWQMPLGARTQGDIGLSRIHQNVDLNPGQDGWRTGADFSITRALGPATTARGSLHLGALEARVKPESLRQWGFDLLVAHSFDEFSLFGQAGYVRTRGLAPLFLFGEKRRDRRIDLAAGIIFSRVRLGGFSPLLRLTHTDSKADIVLYEFKRTRLDIGFTRIF